MHVLGVLPSRRSARSSRTSWRGRRPIATGAAGRWCDLLQQLGVALDFEDVLRQAGGGAVGRPHVARALCRAGGRARREAFDRYIGRGRPAFVEKMLPTFAEVAALVHRVRRASSRSRTSRIGAPARSSSGSRARGSTRWRPVTPVTTLSPAPDSPTSRSRSGCSAPAAATGTAIRSRREPRRPRVAGGAPRVARAAGEHFACDDEDAEHDELRFPRQGRAS